MMQNDSVLLLEEQKTNRFYKGRSIMSKVMTMLEKFRIVEKTDGEKTEIVKAKESKEVEAAKGQKFDNKHQRSENNGKNARPSNREEDKPILEKSTFEKNKTIEEIYSVYELEKSNINTIFMLGNFINALPENLPYAVRKSSVMNIISASNTNINVLMSDGERRLKVLNQFANDYSSSVTSVIYKHKEEIKKLKQMIDYYEEEIAAKQTMLEEQNNVIKYETQRINNIIGFFKKEE